MQIAAIVFLQVLLVGLALAEEPDAPSTNWSAVSSADNVVQYIDSLTVQVLGRNGRLGCFGTFGRRSRLRLAKVPSFQCMSNTDPN